MLAPSAGEATNGRLRSAVVRAFAFKGNVVGNREENLRNNGLVSKQQ